MKDDGVEKAPQRRAPTWPTVRSRADRGSSLERLIERIDAVRGDTAIGAGHRAGALVRSMRAEAGLSQTALANALGVSQARISEIEAGDGPQGPSWDLMERIAAACGRQIGLLPEAQPSPATAPEIDVEVHYGHVSAAGPSEDRASLLAGPDFLIGPGFNLRFQGAESRLAGEPSAQGRRGSLYGTADESRFVRPEGSRAAPRRRPVKPG